MAIGLRRAAAVARLQAVVAAIVRRRVVGNLRVLVVAIVRHQVVVSLRVVVVAIVHRKVARRQVNGPLVAVASPISRPRPISACTVTDDLPAACGAAQSAVHCPI